ncbi:hypothetical protein OTU49_004023, partial [Cherax quadricarinatus]
MFRENIPWDNLRRVSCKEVRALQRACVDIEPGGNYRPGITYIVAQKSHNTRFFWEEKEGEGEVSNVPPGTVVDTHITHHKYREFYLTSHPPNEASTSRPTHYQVMYDDNNLTMDQLETLTHAMCHLDARFPHSVSMPMPSTY